MENLKVNLLTTCPFCGEMSAIEVFESDYDKYCKGGLVQDCFPYLSADEREQLISGICPTCWEKTFG